MSFVDDPFSWPRSKPLDQVIKRASAFLNSCFLEETLSTDMVSKASLSNERGITERSLVR